MKSYWIRPIWKALSDVPLGAKLGIGVTHENLTDAIYAIKEKMGLASVWPDAFEVTEITSIDMLDARHVVPNKGNFMQQGIWFPQGY